MAACAGFVASREWFVADDFAFLALVQRPDLFSWQETFLPLRERFWPFYRPLGMQTYFRLGVAAFGLAAPGFYAVSLLVHFARGLVIFLLARRLGCGVRSAAAGALLGVGGAASLGELYSGSIFHYVAVSLATALCVWGFLREGRGAQLGSCVALAVALLCNESAVVLPLLLAASGLVAGPAQAGWRLARRAAPHALITAAYLVLRFRVIAADEARVLYTPRLDAHAAANAAAQLAIGAGGGAPLALLAALGLAGALAVAARRADDRDLARGAVFCSVWALLALAPFSVLPFPQRRFSIPVEAPLALLAALALEALWRSCVPRARRGLEAALLVLPLLAFPWAELRERAARPQGELPRRLVRFVEDGAFPAGSATRLVVLYGVEGLADRESGERFRYLAFNGAVVHAVWPEGRISVRFHDLNQRPPRSVLRPDGRFVALLPDLTLAAASESLLDRELPRAFAPAGPGPAGE
jgi:hypothetical protein